MQRPTKTDSKHALRREAAKRKAELARNGICIACAERPVTLNQDGTTSIRCVECKANQPKKNRVHKLSNSEAGRRKRDCNKSQFRDDWGVDEDHGFIDQPRFRLYAVTVARIIKQGNTSIGEQKRAMGDAFNERMHIDALEALLSAGEITERLSGSFTRYEPCVVRRIADSPQFNKGPAPPASRTYPFALLSGNDRLVLA